MKKILAGSVILLGGGLSGCVSTVTVHSARPGAQIIDLDARTKLAVSVEGVQTRPTDGGFEGVPRPKEGEPIHRVLNGADGKVLFAYDLQVSKSGTGGEYHFLLKPVGQGPTFDATREVTMKAHEDAVRVELMEQPGTGRKVEDVFRLVDSDGISSETRDISVGAHLRKAHEMIFRWIHGQ